MTRLAVFNSKPVSRGVKESVSRPYVVVPVPPKRKARISWIKTGRSVLNKELRKLVPVAIFNSSAAGLRHGEFHLDGHPDRSTPRMKIPAEAGILKKCGNHLLSPFDYHRPCGLHYRVRNGNGCFPARVLTALDIIVEAQGSSRANYKNKNYSVTFTGQALNALLYTFNPKATRA